MAVSPQVPGVPDTTIQCSGAVMMHLQAELRPA